MLVLNMVQEERGAANGPVGALQQKHNFNFHYNLFFLFREKQVESVLGVLYKVLNAGYW